MKNHKSLMSLLTFVLCGLFVVPAFAADAQYIGGKKCMMCHKSASRGNQWDKWLNSPHAQAYATLAGEESKKIAKEMGIEDPQKSDKCLKCHVTGFAAPAAQKAESYDMTEGISCEACHGPGSLYKTMTIMKALRAGTQDAKAVAFNHGDEKTCLTCHNEESPTYKPFNFQERFKEIAHPLPTE